MQRVGAYLLERRDGMEMSTARSLEASNIRAEIMNWLRSKRAEGIAEGTYRPEDGSSGTFYVREATDESRSWWMLQLSEETTEGRLFSTSISVTNCKDRVALYATLETGWSNSHIMPVDVDPRCPRILRDLIDLPGRWYHGSSSLRQLQVVAGFDSGEALASELLHSERNVPFVVVSKDRDSVLLPDLDSKLAYDLAGLANVAVVDYEASLALTDRLGYDFSCYSGAVRLYWPQLSLDSDCFSHPLWTATRLRSTGFDSFDTRERLRKQLRSLIFRAATLSAHRPRETDEIQDAAQRRVVIDLRHRASSLQEYEQLADSYAIENDQLRAERSALRAQLEEVQAQFAALEATRDALQAHLRAAKPDSIPPPAGTDGIEPGSAAEDADAAPMPGEFRFYKKIAAKTGHDVMKRVSDCGCNSWQSGHAADKARKGIARLEHNRSDWKTMQHCGSCTGGGMWKVRW